MTEKENTVETINQIEDPNVYMSKIHEYLKVLDYESKFCNPKGISPF